MERTCLGAKKVDSNDSPFYAPVTEEAIRLKKKKKVIAWLTEALRPELFFRLLKRFFELSFLYSMHIVPTENKEKQASKHSMLSALFCD